MSEYQFELNVDVAQGSEPQVRMWIDDQPTGDLSSEREVTLVSEGHGRWTASFAARGASFIYRVGLVGAPGSQWSLIFRSAGDEGEELLFDSDELTMSKEWLVGTCEAFDVAAPRVSREIALRPQLLSS